MAGTLLLATKNNKKVQEMREILACVDGVEVCSAAELPEIPEPDESGQTFLENARQKAVYYAAESGLLALADDSGLVVDALMGRPGIHSSRYAATDEERISKLLGEMQMVPDGERTARFECAMVLARPGGVLAQTQGTLEGIIARERRGTKGFGYDPIFYVPEAGRHLAEVDAHVKNEISHRGKALRAMLPLLLQVLR
ncbi:MAG: RdgB/HAM1 family non-canonical purine NTP pyrophosphatase [Candidatus Sumerlaeaceae bacterium]